MNCRKTLIAGGSAALACLLAGRAQAQTLPNCNDATMFPNPIYISGRARSSRRRRRWAPSSRRSRAPPNDAHLQGDSSCDGPKRHPRQHDPHGHRRLLHGRSRRRDEDGQENARSTPPSRSPTSHLGHFLRELCRRGLTATMTDVKVPSRR